LICLCLQNQNQELIKSVDIVFKQLVVYFWAISFSMASVFTSRVRKIKSIQFLFEQTQDVFFFFLFLLLLVSFISSSAMKSDLKSQQSSFTTIDAHALKIQGEGPWGFCHFLGGRDCKNFGGRVHLFGVLLHFY
jgi:hypothetical protein